MVYFLWFYHALFTQYAINKTKAAQQEQQMVAELDSALNEWIDTIPDHCAYLVQSSYFQYLSLIAFGSAVGSSQERHHVSQPVGFFVFVVSCIADRYSPAIHTIAGEILYVVVSFPRNLHQCSTVCIAHHGRTVLFNNEFASSVLASGV